MKYGFGVDLGGTFVKIALFNETGEILSKWIFPTVLEDHGSRILSDIAESIRESREENGISDEDVLGVGIGVPGPVNSQGVVNRCVNLGWGVFNICDALSSLTGLNVKAGNDANVAALGEFWKGGGQGYNNMVMVTIGTGVGGGIIIEGRLLHGAHGSGAELGHMVLNRDETELCNCGKRGCVEQYCSANGIVRMAGSELNASGEASLLRKSEKVTCKDIFDAGRLGDRLALRVLEKYYAYMGEFLADVCNVVNPEVVVLGGAVSKDSDMLIGGMMPYFKRYVFHAASEVEFVRATLGNDAGAYGAFKLVLDAMRE